MYKRQVGQTEHAIYGATKGAVISFTRAVAWEVADYNIRVNSVSPGSVDTPMLRSDIQLESTRTGMPFEEVKKLREAEDVYKRQLWDSACRRWTGGRNGAPCPFTTGNMH